jgi:hypothetical protein
MNYFQTPHYKATRNEGLKIALQNHKFVYAVLRFRFRTNV